MKYRGSISWANSDCGASAPISLEVDGKTFSGSYTYSGDKYDLVLTEDKKDYFIGKIYYKGEEGGKVYLWKFSKDDQILLKGPWNDKWAGSFECFIHLHS